MDLYTYYRSSAAYRVRIALNLKKLAYEPIYISLLKNRSENYKPEYKDINPQAMVPTLVSGSHTLTQSNAIIEFLEEQYPVIPLLPEDKTLRAETRSYAQLIACDIHPLNNIKVLDYLREKLATNEDNVQGWYQHWIQEGFSALETRLEKSDLSGKYCIGDTLSIGDIYLIPQVYNAYRYHCDMSNYPLIKKINNNCLSLEAFKSAVPENQPDFIV